MNGWQPPNGQYNNWRPPHQHPSHQLNSSYHQTPHHTQPIGTPWQPRNVTGLPQTNRPPTSFSDPFSQQPSHNQPTTSTWYSPPTSSLPNGVPNSNTSLATTTSWDHQATPPLHLPSTQPPSATRSIASSIGSHPSAYGAIPQKPPATHPQPYGSWNGQPRAMEAYNTPYQPLQHTFQMQQQPTFQQPPPNYKVPQQTHQPLPTPIPQDYHQQYQHHTQPPLPQESSLPPSHHSSRKPSISSTSSHHFPSHKQNTTSVHQPPQRLSIGHTPGIPLQSDQSTTPAVEYSAHPPLDRRLSGTSSLSINSHSRRLSSESQGGIFSPFERPGSSMGLQTAVEQSTITSSDHLTKTDDHQTVHPHTTEFDQQHQNQLQHQDERQAHDQVSQDNHLLTAVQQSTPEVAQHEHRPDVVNDYAIKEPSIGVTPQTEEEQEKPNVTLATHQINIAGMFGASDEEDEFEAMLRQSPPDFQPYQISSHPSTSSHDTYPLTHVPHPPLSTAAVSSTQSSVQPVEAPATNQIATPPSLQQTPLQHPMPISAPPPIQQPQEHHQAHGQSGYQISDYELKPSLDGQHGGSLHNNASLVPDYPTEGVNYRETYPSSDVDPIMGRDETMWSKQPPSAPSNISQEWSSEPQSVDVSSYVMMSENALDGDSPTNEFGEATNIGDSIDGDDLNLPWTTKSQFVTMTQNSMSGDTHQNDVLDPSTAPESCPTSLQPVSNHPSPTDGLPLGIFPSDQSDQQGHPTDLSPSDVSAEPSEPSPDVSVNHQSDNQHNTSLPTDVSSHAIPPQSHQPQLSTFHSTHNVPPLTQPPLPSVAPLSTLSTPYLPPSLQRPQQQPSSIDSSSIQPPIRPFHLSSPSEVPDHDDQRYDQHSSSLSTQPPLQTSKVTPPSPLFNPSTKPSSSSPFLTYSNPYDHPPTGSQPNSNEPPRPNERKQMKEMRFYSGAHPALRGHSSSNAGPPRSILPPMRPPIAPSGQQDYPPTGESFMTTEHPNETSLPSSTDQFTNGVRPPPMQNYPAEMSVTAPTIQHRPPLQHYTQPNQQDPVPKQPGQYTEVAVGLEGRAFAFDAQGQPVDLSVALATARSSLTSNEPEHRQPNEGLQAWTAILEGLRGHHGPLLDVPMDHINRLVDFYIDQKSHALIQTKGNDKDVLLWILLKRIGMSHRPPPSLELNEVVAFLYDCTILGDFLNLINDQLPKLTSDLPSCLPSSLPIRAPPIKSAPPPSSTAWAECCRWICSGQAAEAVDFAMNFGMWGHALSISLLVSPECFNAVRIEYAASLNVFGQPKKSQYWIKNSEGPPASSGPFESLHLDCVKMLFFLHALPAAIHQQDVVETEKKFREMLHCVEDLSSTWLTRIRLNVSYLGLQHPNCRLWLRALGKELVERKEISIGHCALILSGSIPCKDFGLLGSAIPLESYLDIQQREGSMIDFDWKHFQLTEFFERVLAKWSNTNAPSPYFDVPKFLYSRILRIGGPHEMADRYLNQITPQSGSLLSRALEQEAPNLQRRPMNQSKQDNNSSNRLGHGFGISSLIRTFLNQDD